MEMTHSLHVYNLEKHPSEKNNFETIYKKSKSDNLSNSRNYENWFKTPDKTDAEIHNDNIKLKRMRLKELNEKLNKIREEQIKNNSYFNTDNNNNKTVKNRNLKKPKPSRKPIRKYKKSKSKKILKQNNNNNNSRKSISYNSILFSPKPVKKLRPAWKPAGNAKKIRLG
jgi:hypothetical protein